MATDQLICALPALMSAVTDPSLLLWTQIGTYVIAILFFGHISAYGYRGYLNRFAHFGLQLVLGGIALLGGLAFGSMIPMDAIWRAFLADFFIVGTAYAVLVLIAVWLLSHNVFNVAGIQKEIERLNALLAKAGAVAQQDRRQRMRDPALIAGIVVLAVLVTAALASFRGFPSFLDVALQAAGMSQQDLQTAMSLLQQASTGC